MPSDLLLFFASFLVFVFTFCRERQIPDELLVRANANKECQRTAGAGAGTGDGVVAGSAQAASGASSNVGGRVVMAEASFQGVVREVARQLVREKEGKVRGVRQGGRGTLVSRFRQFSARQHDTVVFGLVVRNTCSGALDAVAYDLVAVVVVAGKSTVPWSSHLCHRPCVRVQGAKHAQC